MGKSNKIQKPASYICKTKLGNPHFFNGARRRPTGPGRGQLRSLWGCSAGMALQHLKGRVLICNRVWCLHPNKGRGEGKSISRAECEERQSLLHMRPIPSICHCFGSSVGDQTRQFLREERESQCPVKDNAAEEFNGALRVITGRSGGGGCVRSPELQVTGGYLQK